jgi:hypothetical protein
MLHDHDEYDVWSEPDCSLSRTGKLSLALMVGVLVGAVVAGLLASDKI